jgi:Family of unknown function (DUF6459)
MSTVEVAPHGPRPPIRLRPVPRCDPPYDDELEPQWWVTANQLALEWPRPPTDPGRHDFAGHSGVGAGEAGDDGYGCAGGGSARAGRMRGIHWPAAGGGGRLGEPGRAEHGGAGGDAKLAVRRFVHVCVEVLNGYRPAAHLRPLSLPKDAAGVVEQAVAGTGRVAQIRHGGARARAVDRRERGPGPVAVLKLQLCYPRQGAVEATILLVTGERTWAMALRMELHQQTWAATTLRLV